MKTTTISQSQSEIKGKVEKKAGKRIGYNYIILRSLKESQKNDVVTCLYIKSLTNFGFCVIKEGTYGDTKDKQGRDIKDRLLWQKELHELLQDKVRIPRILGSFEENGNYYLVMERIKGKPLNKFIHEQSNEIREGLLSGNKTGLIFLDCMLQIVEILNNLHQLKIVHRDATVNNFIITPQNKVAIIDMELSYSLQRNSPSPPFTLGTFGYMSPEQEITQTPTIKEDIFSVGAIMLQVWTGISPYKLTRDSTELLTEKVIFFVPDESFSKIIIQCLHTAPHLRPSLKEVQLEIIKYRDHLLKKKRQLKPRIRFYEKEQLMEIAGRAIATLGTPLLADEANGWFSENIHIEKRPEKNNINKAWYTSFNRGASGVLYMLSQANALGINIEQLQPLVEKSLNLIESKYINRIEEVSLGYHFGPSGIAASLTSCIEKGIIKPSQKHLEWIQILLSREPDIAGFEFGLAGHGMAHQLCRNYLQDEIVINNLKRVANKLTDLQQNDGSWIKNFANDKKRATRGFANGVAGNVFFLLSYGKQYNSKEALDAAARGLEWLMKKSIHKNGTIQWLSSMGKKLSPWWAEGEAGIALTFIKAYEVLEDSKYKEYATLALYNHPTQVINTNLSQANGLSGLGEIYLEAHRILGDKEWFERAQWITQVIVHMKNEHPEFGSFWLAEHEKQPVADFMIGNSGIIHFLLRFCYPDILKHPLLC